MVKNSGQSLIEVLIAIAIVTMVLVTLVAAVIIALRGVRFSREKIRANFLTSAGLEWVRNQRGELGWSDFYSLARSDGAHYCLTDLTFSQPGSCATAQTIDTIFTREVVLTAVGGNSITVEVAVSWDDGGQEFASQVSTTLGNWETQ